MSLRFTLDGQPVEVADETASLLDALREELGVRSVKDGCSPQGQCGCCTVLVDGAARVACVTPVRRVAGRIVVTVDGLDPADRDRLVDAFVAHGASQCGFCTPGILCRLAALGPVPIAPAAVESALLAHLCRCTGWRTIVDAAGDPAPPTGSDDPDRAVRAARRATLEGGTPQRTGPDIVLGRGGFADDRAPAGCLVAVPAAAGGWSVGASLAEARAGSGKVQGRRSGQPMTHPLEVPPGDWAVTLRTAWVEPAYLEPDASWCEPGGEPASPVANGGAFGGKVASPAATAARELADQLGRPVRVVLSREDVVRLGPKRPPVAGGVRADGTGILRIAAAMGVADAVAAVAPGIQLEEVAVAGPPVSAAIRAAGWAEAAVLLAAGRAVAAGEAGVGEAGVRSGRVGPGRATASVTGPSGATATATVETDPTGAPVSVAVTVACGEPLDETVLCSYVTGAAHMALGWVGTEGIAVGPDGQPEDLTIRSFGILRARETPPIVVTVATPRPADDPAPVNGSDAAFAAVAAAAWIAQGCPPTWPTRRA